MICPKSGVYIPDEFNKLIPVNRLIPAPWNPNRMSDKVFQKLVRNIKEDGFLQTMEVVPLTGEFRKKYVPEDQDDGGEFWLIVGGHHRWDAAKLLDMEMVPVVIKKDWDEDMAKFKNVALNMIRGRLDPDRFTRLYMDMAEKYGDELVREQMALVEEKAFKSLIKDVKDGLPEPMKKQLESREDEIHNTDDLQRVLAEMFSKHGDTLPFSYMVFTYGGKSHLWVQTDRITKARLDELTQWCYDNEVDINRVFAAFLRGGMTLEEAKAIASETAGLPEEEGMFD